VKLGIAWICSYCGVITGMLIEASDEIPKCTQEPPGPWFPVTGFLFICLPIIVAYAIGIKTGRGAPGAWTPGPGGEP